ncbi:MAG TPA: hypothetical protein VHY08_04075 [Bacillota bacterium]|nr:hypothetical protein [Bacillota bacterium]
MFKRTGYDARGRAYRMLKYGIVCLLLLFPTFIIQAESEVMETVGQGQIDWERGVLQVKGSGALSQNPGTSLAKAKLMAERAAKADAYRNGLEALEGVRVNSETLVKDFETESDEIRTSVQGYLKGGRFISTNYTSDGICEVMLELPLSGRSDFSRLLYDSVKPRITVGPTMAPVQPDYSSVSYTGIIIDTRGLDVKPALYPQVFDTDGFLLYGPTVVNFDLLKTKTLVAYTRSVERALVMDRVGKKPLQIKATSVIKATNGEITDLILSVEATRIFRGAAVGLLAKAAVVFIID